MTALMNFHDQEVNATLEHAIDDEGDEEPDSCTVSVAVCDAIER